MEVIDGNLVGVTIACREACKLFLKQESGVIINIASDLSVISPNQKIYQKEGLELGDQAVKPITYSVIKSGLVGMTKYLATYWLNGNIRCNSLSPGGVYVDQDMEFVEKISEHIPLGRMAKLNEYHSAIQFLISDASSYLNGHNLVIDGGKSETIYEDDLILDFFNKP